MIWSHWGFCNNEDSPQLFAVDFNRYSVRLPRTFLQVKPKDWCRKRKRQLCTLVYLVVTMEERWWTKYSVFFVFTAHSWNRRDQCKREYHTTSQKLKFLKESCLQLTSNCTCFVVDNTTETIEMNYLPRVQISVPPDRDYVMTLTQTKIVYDQLLADKHGKLTEVCKQLFWLQLRWTI